MNKKKFVAWRSSKGRQEFQDTINTLAGSSQKSRRARILLTSDVNGPAWTDARIADAFSCRVQLVENLWKRLVTESLAMELRKSGEGERCTELFQGLIQDDPPHVPAFLMFAQYYAENDKVDEARAVLRTGIEIARAQNELHAASEMGELLGALGDA